MSLPQASRPVTPMVRHALGLPAGSVRALLTLAVVGGVCALLLLSHGKDEAIPIPAYLIYLLFLVVGNYFAARGSEPVRTNESYPLYLPRGWVRFIILASLGATITYKMVNDREGLVEQFKRSVESIQEQPYLPLVVLGGFLVGAVVGAIIGKRRSGWAQDVEAWFSLIAVTVMVIAVMIELVINPNVSPTSRLHLPNFEGFLTAVVSFYFGERS